MLGCIGNNTTERAIVVIIVIIIKWICIAPIFNTRKRLEIQTRESLLSVNNIDICLGPNSLEQIKHEQLLIM